MAPEGRTDDEVESERQDEPREGEVERDDV
jgi:hypothetical protein